MFRKAWKEISPFLAHPVRQVVFLTVVSVVVGLAEASVLVLVVRSAVLIAARETTATTSTLPGLNVRWTPGVLLWAAAAMGVLSIMGHYLQARLKAHAMSEVAIRTRSQAVEAFMGASWNRQAQDREGALQETMSSLSEHISDMAGYLVSGAAASMNLAAFLVFAAILNPVAMILILGVGVALSFVMRPLGRLTRRRSKAYVSSNLQFVEEISRTTSLAMEYRVFGVEGAATTQLRELISQTARRQQVTRVSASFNETLYRDLAALFLVVALAGMYLIKSLEVASISTVVVLIVRGLMYSNMLQIQVISLNQDFPRLEVFQQRVAELNNDQAEFGNTPISKITSFELCDVGYDYADGTTTLDDITLKLRPGEILGVVGPSGGGKSTFVQVLLRLRPPCRGTVLVNGQPYEVFDRKNWADLVALVSQEPRLMEGTIADNIGFLRPGISQTDIEQAAVDAHVAEDIRHLGAGFDTPLGSRGLGLSGGQKQRVAIARALVGQPQVLVLDEPTSALDVNSERLLQSTISKLKGSVTMIIVAHRLSTLDVCDRLLVLRNGRIEALGTRAELESQPGFFQSIATAISAGEPANGEDPGRE